MEPGAPGRSSESFTWQWIVAVMVAGVPTGAENAAVEIVTALEAHRRPAVDIDCAPASRPAAAACGPVRASEAARALVCAASLTVVRANQSRPPVTSSPSINSSAGTSRVSSTVADPRSSRLAAPIAAAHG